MSHTNAWSNPSKGGGEEAARMAAFLEERSRTPDVKEVNTTFCSFVDARQGERILEVGCGSGVICRLLAPSLVPEGGMIGVDISPDFIFEAQKYARQEGLADQILFTCAAAEALPYREAAFDCACAARLLLHVNDPDAVLDQIRGVVRPGGRVVVMDWDFDSVVVDHSNRELTRRLLHWRNDHHGGDNWSGRQLWRRMTMAGFHNLRLHPIVSVAHGEADGLTQSLWRAAQVSCQTGAISAAEEQAWVGELKERIQAGTYFASIVYFIVIGWKY